MQKISETDLMFQYGDHGNKKLFNNDKYEWGILVLQFDGESGLYINQDSEEIMFYVVNGCGTIRVNDKFLPVSEGDAVKVEPGEMYNVICTSPEIKVVYLKYIPTKV
ncbi:MAG: cupin domain-containing protein [Candidatus Omnitrophota bacterium]